jgi:ABC-type nitrate/sulfonate/bicarbonate transport system substrate-binding protein
VLEWWVCIRLVVIAIGCWLSACILSAAPIFAADKLRISYASVTGNTAGITYVAQRAGLFEKQGLDVELILITGGPASISALLNADVDLDMRAPVAALQAMAHGVKLTFLLSQSNILEYDVVTRPEIKDIKQLKGKKVGIIRFGGISELMVRYLFQKLGLDADKDIAIIQVGQARFVALEKGAIDATVFASAESAYAKRSGFRILDMPTLPFFGSTIVASPAVVAKRADVMTRFMRGYLDGIRFFLNERERSSQYLADLLRTKDRDMIDLAYKNHPQHAMGRKPYPDMAAG